MPASFILYMLGCSMRYSPVCMHGMSSCLQGHESHHCISLQSGTAESTHATGSCLAPVQQIMPTTGLVNTFVHQANKTGQAHDKVHTVDNPPPPPPLTLHGMFGSMFHIVSSITIIEAMTITITIAIAVAITLTVMITVTVTVPTTVYIC